MRTQLIITQIKMKNGTSLTMGPILPSTPTQHRDIMQKIRQTDTHAHTHTCTHTHAYTANSDESNSSLAYIKNKFILVFYIKLILVLC